MEEQNTGAKPRLITSIRTTYKQEELLFSLSRIIRKQAEPPTTNRIKRARTANKTLYTSTLHTSIVPYHTGENRRTDTRKQMKCTLCTSSIGGGGVKNKSFGG